MDIYLCSTVRHLLFSLLMALSKNQRKSHIFLICDQQKLNKENYDGSKLPKNILISFINRKDINKNLTKTPKGLLLKLSASLNVQTSYFLRKKINEFLFSYIILGKSDPINLDIAKLYLFNDRNKIARLFRLAFKNYSIIEDGLSNYSGIKFNLFEKIKAAISISGQKMRYLGDDKRCTEIYLLKPNDADEYIKPKVKKIDFISTENINNYCYSFFKVEPLYKNYEYIIATQPISVVQFSESGCDVLIYEKILNKLKNNNAIVALKVHPRESVKKYQEKLSGVDFIESKIPLELVLFSSEIQTHIVSIYSTAGMGFEGYCNRITLINDTEVEHIDQLLSSWKTSPEKIDVRIKEVLN